MNAYTTALAALLGVLTSMAIYSVATGLMCGWPPYKHQLLTQSDQAELKRSWYQGVAWCGLIGLGFTRIWTIILEALLT